MCVCVCVCVCACVFFVLAWRAMAQLALHSPGCSRRATAKVLG